MTNPKTHGPQKAMNDRVVQAFAAKRTIMLKDETFETVRNEHTHWISSEKVSFKVGETGATFVSDPFIPWSLKDVIFLDSEDKPLALM